MNDKGKPDDPQELNRAAPNQKVRHAATVTSLLETVCTEREVQIDLGTGEKNRAEREREKSSCRPVPYFALSLGAPLT